VLEPIPATSRAGPRSRRPTARARYRGRGREADVAEPPTRTDLRRPAQPVCLPSLVARLHVEPECRPLGSDTRDGAPRGPVGRPELQDPPSAGWLASGAGLVRIARDMAERLGRTPVLPQPGESRRVIGAEVQDGARDRHQPVEIEGAGAAMTARVTASAWRRSTASRSWAARIRAPCKLRLRCAGSTRRWNQSSSRLVMSSCHGIVPAPRAASWKAVTNLAGPVTVRR
jgi:hypothetical protein